MTTLEITQPISGTIFAPQSSLEHRDGVLAKSKEITQVTSQDELELAVAALRDLTAITKETESARKAIKAPIIALGRQVESVADDFVAPVEKDKARLTGLVNHWQQLEMRKREEEERKAAEDKRKADQAAADAQRKIEEQQREIERQRLALESAELSKKQRAEAEAKQKEAEAKLLASQLDAEEANLASHSAALQINAPTNTPRGLVTKARYDFEIVKPFLAAAKLTLDWTWHAGTESLKFDRAGFLKALNNEATPHALLPPDGQQSIVHSDCGIRIYSQVTTHIRA